MKKVTKRCSRSPAWARRFLPATKASPKEMLPVVDKPLIQYAVEEAVAAGITDMVFITGRNKRSIEDHFDKAYELETELEARGKHALLELVRRPCRRASTASTSARPSRSASATPCCAPAPVVGDEPFAVLLADDLHRCRRSAGAAADGGRLRQSPLLGARRAERARADTGATASSAPSRPGDGCPEHDTASSRSRSPEEGALDAGRDRPLHADPAHLPSPAPGAPGAGGEIQLTDAIAALIKEEPVLAFPSTASATTAVRSWAICKATIAPCPRRGEWFRTRDHGCCHHGPRRRARCRCVRPRGRG
jgi:UTP--glucose-1-phosphate uridylyltransferase